MVAYLLTHVYISLNKVLIKKMCRLTKFLNADSLVSVIQQLRWSYRFFPLVFMFMFFKATETIIYQIPSKTGMGLV